MGAHDRNLQRITPERVACNPDINPVLGIENRRRRMVIASFCLVGALFLLAFGVNALVEGYRSLALVLVGSGLGLAASWFLVRGSANCSRATAPVSAVILFLYFVLLVTGGVENTGLYWCFAFTPLLQYVIGGVRGSVVVALVVVATALILFLPGTPLLATEYAWVVRTRFFGALVAVTLMALVYEYSRHDSYRQLTDLSRRMYEDARTDPLTDLPNRRAMEEILELESYRAARSGRPFSVILADLDYFKAINDDHGHETGDRVLIETAARLQARLRQQDMVARLGGRGVPDPVAGHRRPGRSAGGGETASRRCRPAGQQRLHPDPDHHEPGRGDGVWPAVAGGISASRGP